MTSFLYARKGAFDVWNPYELNDNVMLMLIHFFNHNFFYKPTLQFLEYSDLNNKMISLSLIFILANILYETYGNKTIFSIVNALKNYQTIDLPQYLIQDFKNLQTKLPPPQINKTFVQILQFLKPDVIIKLYNCECWCNNLIPNFDSKLQNQMEWFETIFFNFFNCYQSTNLNSLIMLKELDMTLIYPFSLYQICLLVRICQKLSKKLSFVTILQDLEFHTVFLCVFFFDVLFLLLFLIFV